MDATSNEFLFGEESETQLNKEPKALKQSINLFTGLKDNRRQVSSTSKGGSSSSQSSNPFPEGPLSRGRGRGCSETPSTKVSEEEVKNVFILSSKLTSVNIEQLKVNPLFKNLFPQKLITNLPPAGKLKWYLKNWKVLTQDPQIIN